MMEIQHNITYLLTYLLTAVPCTECTVYSVNSIGLHARNSEVQVVHRPMYNNVTRNVTFISRIH